MDGEVVDSDVVTGLLGTLVKRFKFPREDTALVYSSRRMVFREADFPYMSLSDLRSTLPFQSKGMIPLPIEESELDFVPLSVLDDEQNGKQLHGILVANALSISFEDAERIKNQIGLQNVTGDERLEKAEEAIRETTAQLIVGVRNKVMAKELIQANTSDGDKTSLLSMNVSDISKALKAGGVGRSGKPENPSDWTMRANLIPSSIVALNRDRAIKYLLTYALIFVTAVAIAISVFMAIQAGLADHRVEVAQEKTISLQKEKVQFKEVEDTLNSLDDSQKAKIAMLYDEMDWMKVAMRSMARCRQVASIRIWN